MRIEEQMELDLKLRREGENTWAWNILIGVLGFIVLLLSVISFEFQDGYNYQIFIWYIVLVAAMLEAYINPMIKVTEEGSKKIVFSKYRYTPVGRSLLIRSKITLLLRFTAVFAAIFQVLHMVALIENKSLQFNFYGFYPFILCTICFVVQVLQIIVLAYIKY